MSTYSPRTVEDLAFQVIFADDDGDGDMNPCQAVLGKRAYEIVGITPGRWYRGER